MQWRKRQLLNKPFNQEWSATNSPSGIRDRLAIHFYILSFNGSIKRNIERLLPLWAGARATRDVNSRLLVLGSILRCQEGPLMGRRSSRH